ncbi:MAG: hypothetical protein WBC98_08875 [Candidatus Zixiibacteriota bacterium]
MLSRMNSFGLLTVMAIAFLLLACFAGSTVYADGGGGQMPDPPPVQTSPPDDGSGGDSGTTLMDVIETVLGFII